MTKNTTNARRSPWPPQDARAILGSAAATIDARMAEYGDPSDQWAHAAALWNAYLGDQLAEPISPAQACWLMTLLKASRAQMGKFNIDNARDAAGYAGLAGQLGSEQE